MSYHLNLSKLVQDIRGPRGFAALNEEVFKLKAEIQKLKDSWRPEAEARLKKAQIRFKQLEGLVRKNQKQFEKQLHKTLTQVRHQAVKAEGDVRKILKGRKTTKKTAARKPRSKKRS